MTNDHALQVPATFGTYAAPLDLRSSLGGGSGSGVLLEPLGAVAHLDCVDVLCEQEG